MRSSSYHSSADWTADGASLYSHCMHTTTVEQLEHWMRVPRETEGLEFKSARTGFHGDRLMDYCVGIGNEGGGKLILGVTNTPPRKVVGTTAVNDTQEMQKKILDKLHFEVKIEEMIHPNGRVVICHIPTRPPATPLHHDGRYWMRSGEELRAMSPDRLREIFEEGKPDWLMRSARSGCSANEVINLLDIPTYYRLLRQSEPSIRTVVLERFESEKLIVEDANGYTITNLGAILFARRLDDFEGLDRKGPRVIVYEGPHKLENSRVFQPGSKGYAVGFEGLIDFINSHVPSNEIIGKALREQRKMFPEIAIRELVANALIHQDFNETGTSVTVEIYSDRLEVSNPGKPIIPTDRFGDEYQSRNERLAGLMRRLRICEEQGLGIDRVIKSTEVYQLPAPDFRVGERHTMAVVYAHKRFEDMDRKERVRACFWHCVLQYLTGQKMTNRSLRDRFDLPGTKLETVSAIIADSMHENKIKPDDPSKPSRRYAKYIPYWA
jgi:ATP-dependent DNA helicase RecG